MSKQFDNNVKEDTYLTSTKDLYSREIIVRELTKTLQAK